MNQPLIDPDKHHAVIFDLDGVVTDTASIHARAWKRLFDEYLGSRSVGDDVDRSPFSDDDYRRHVDGKPRYDGVADFLSSRGVELPWGEPDDPPDSDTVCGLGNRKNRYFLELLGTEGVDPFPDAVDLLDRLSSAGLRAGLYSASRNARRVIEEAGLAESFSARVDGSTAADIGLEGKPAPDVLIEVADRLDAEPGHSVVIEDALAGVEAARRGGFAMIVGMDREGAGLFRDTTDVAVVRTLEEVTILEEASPGRAGIDAAGGDESVDATGSGRLHRISEVEHVLAEWGKLTECLGDRPVQVFVDFDGTLAPIVDDPGAAVMPEETQMALERLAGLTPVCVISGRDLGDVRERVGIDSVWYAGSHGLEISGPDSGTFTVEAAAAQRDSIAAATAELEDALGSVSGCQLERKPFSTAVHYRNVDEARRGEVEARAREIAEANGLRADPGREVIEIRPDIDWDKGTALEYLRDLLADRRGPGTRSPEALPIALYMGDDFTDEDALEALGEDDIGIVVRHTEHGDRMTLARFALDEVAETAELLGRLADRETARR